MDISFASLLPLSKEMEFLTSAVVAELLLTVTKHDVTTFLSGLTGLTTTYVAGDDSDVLTCEKPLDSGPPRLLEVKEDDVGESVVAFNAEGKLGSRQTLVDVEGTFPLTLEGALRQ